MLWPLLTCPVLFPLPPGSQAHCEANWASGKDTDLGARQMQV